MSKHIAKVCIIGAGFMGNQIAFYLMKNGVPVVLVDIASSRLDDARKQISLLIGQFGLETDLMRLLHCSAVLADAVEDCDLVIECVTEDLQLKRRIFSSLQSYCERGGIIATNSSAILASEMEESLGSEEARLRIINMHFLPPVWERPLVEVMRGSLTTDEVVVSVVNFIKSIGLVPIVMKNENRGFVFNFFWQVIKATALDLADRDIATVNDIDLAWRTGMGMKVGPFEVMDMVGLDVVKTVFEHHGQEVPMILAELVRAGKLGRKTGSGFYEYSQ